MKRILCLLLCLLLLFSIGCKEEEPAKTPPNAPDDDTSDDSAPVEEFVPEISADSFYTYDGDLHNVYVSLTLTTTELTAPVTTLSFEIKNDTDYIILFKPTQGAYVWERWENGGWTSFTKYTGTGTVNRDETSDMDILSPRMTVTRTENFPIPLEAGIYRLRRQYRLTNEKEWISFIIGAPGIECVVETYFTILPAPEA